MPIKLGLKYLQKIAKGTVSAFFICEELRVFRHSKKRILDILGPPIEAHTKDWGSCIPNCGPAVPPLKDLLEKMIDQLYNLFNTQQCSKTRPNRLVTRTHPSIPTLLRIIPESLERAMARKDSNELSTTMDL
ncbi:hypothetical protein ACH5RR_013255, partial [Cinchona calisaya]